MTTNVTKIDQAIEVIEGQLQCLREVLGRGRETPLEHYEVKLIGQSFTIIELAIRAITK